jgi:hypothetical protein
MLVLGIDGVSCESFEKLHNAHSIHFIVFTLEIVTCVQIYLEDGKHSRENGVSFEVYLLHTFCINAC